MSPKSVAPNPPQPLARDLIRTLGLEPLPGEGGFYIRTHTAPFKLSPEALPGEYETPRPLATTILYLLTPDTCSALHRLPTDEVFHFLLGDPVRMLNLHPGGRAEVIILGNDVLAGQVVQWVVPKGVWQGSRLEPGGEYALLGATMSPGFDWPDLELAEAGKLAREYPEVGEEITALAPRNNGTGEKES